MIELKIILASTSPRRKNILENLGVDFEIYKNHTEEKLHDHLSPEVNVMSIAFEKAISVAKDYPEDIVLAADTIVVYENEVLEKPIDALDALRMLKQLNNDRHYVYTGFALIHGKENVKIVDYEKTEITFKNNSIETLKKYCASGEPEDKAGAYAIQDKGALLVEKINGDYFNIVGLPIAKIAELLSQNFNYKLL